MRNILIAGLMILFTWNAFAADGFYERQQAYKDAERARDNEHVRAMNMKLENLLMKRIGQFAKSKRTQAIDIVVPEFRNGISVGNHTFKTTSGLACEIHEDVSMESGCPHPKCLMINEYGVICYDSSGHKSYTLLPGYGPY